MSHLLRGAFLGAAFAAACLAGNDANTYHPMHTGDTWTYSVQSPFGGASEHTMEVVDELYGYWFKLSGHPFAESDKSRWFRNYKSRTYLWKGFYSKVIETDGGVGSTLSVNAYALCLDPATFTLIDDNVTVSTPAGNFTGCLQYSVSSSCADAGLTGFTLAPAVGIVQYSESNIAGSVVYTLKSATVGGVDYPQQANWSGVKVCVETSDRDLVHGSGQSSAKLDVRLTIENNSSSDLLLRHSSGQKYDVTLAPSNDKDNPVYTWSHGMLFTMAMSVTTIVAGDSKTWELTLPGTTDAGTPLPDGDYVLRMWTTGGDYASETTVHFSTNP